MEIIREALWCDPTSFATLEKGGSELDFGLGVDKNLLTKVGSVVPRPTIAIKAITLFAAVAQLCER